MTRATDPREDEQHRLLFDWLDPVDLSTNHNSALGLHEPDTGNWIFETAVFKDWLSKESSAVWLHAKRECSIPLFRYPKLYQIGMVTDLQLEPEKQSWRKC
jgi:hypothetical protein